MVTSGLAEWFVVIRSYPILWSNYALQKNEKSNCNWTSFPFKMHPFNLFQTLQRYKSYNGSFTKVVSFSDLMTDKNMIMPDK